MEGAGVRGNVALRVATQSALGSLMAISESEPNPLLHPQLIRESCAALIVRNLGDGAHRKAKCLFLRLHRSKTTTQAGKRHRLGIFQSIVAGLRFMAARILGIRRVFAERNDRLEVRDRLGIDVHAGWSHGRIANSWLPSVHADAGHWILVPTLLTARNGSNFDLALTRPRSGPLPPHSTTTGSLDPLDLESPAPTLFTKSRTVHYVGIALLFAAMLIHYGRASIN